MKEVRLRPKTDTNDRNIKMDRAIRFLNEGSKVQFTMLFRGRERAHQEVGFAAFNAIVAQLGEQVKVERPPRFERRRMTMVLAPVKVSKPPKPPKPSKRPTGAGTKDTAAAEVAVGPADLPPVEAPGTSAAS